VKAWGDLCRRTAKAAVACALLAALALPAAAAAEAGAQASVIGGHAASIAEFPSLAYIEADDKKLSFSCTGTVVAPRVVLTAAHCAEDVESGRFTGVHAYAIATGVSNLRQASKTNVFRVAATHVFPGFDPGRVHGDAALLILSSPTSAPPLGLAGPADAPLYGGGAPVSIAGWGLTQAQNRNAPTTLRATTMQIQKSGLCQSRTRSYYGDYSPALQLCLLEPPADKSGSCFGDSGGPAIGQRPDGSAVELGVISVVGPFCSPQAPNVLTRTDLISTWVSEWIAAVETGAPAPVVDPRAPLPSMTRSIGEEFTVFTLTGAFGGRFEKASSVQGGCRRASKVRYKCEIAWITGRTVFAGTVSPFYVHRHDTTSWDSHYVVKWAARRCIFGDAPGRCPIHSKRR
jgi:secreted trypsin-like serine protease